MPCVVTVMCSCPWQSTEMWWSCRKKREVYLQLRLFSKDMVHKKWTYDFEVRVNGGYVAPDEKVGTDILSVFVLLSAEAPCLRTEFKRQRRKEERPRDGETDKNP